MRKRYFMMIAVFALLCISSVFASDNANTAFSGADDGAGAYPDTPGVQALDNASSTPDNIDIPGTYDELKKEIQNISSGNTYDFKRDYKFDGADQTIILQER